MRLTIIGSAPAWSLRPGRPSSCYLVESGPQAIVLDLGHGSFASLASYRDPETVAAIFISHMHPDHHVDLVAMRHYLKFGCVPARNVPLHAPGDLRRRYDAFLDEEDFLAGLPGPPLEPGVLVVGTLSVESRHVTHATDSYAFRLALSDSVDGQGLVYSGDCGKWEDLLPLIRPGDTLLCEAFWGAGQAVVGAEHLTARDAARAATKGQASQLILTHVADENDPGIAAEQAGQIFGSPVALAEPGMQLDIA